MKPDTNIGNGFGKFEMAKFQVRGFEEYERALSRLGGQTEEIAKQGVYVAAKIVADAIKDALKGLPVVEGDIKGLPPVGTPESPLTGVSRKQKEDLIDSMGIPPIEMNHDGYIETKIGWDGYGSIPTKKYPKGVPNQMLIRSIESGTSFRKKNPVIRRAVTKSKKAAIEALNAEIEKAIGKEMK